MPIGTALAIGLTAATVGGGVASSVIGSRAAGRVADTQAQAAERAAQLQRESDRENLAFQKDVFNTQQQQIAPWLNQGTAGLVNLSYLLGLPITGNYFPSGSTATMGAPGSPMSAEMQAAREAFTRGGGPGRFMPQLDGAEPVFTGSTGSVPRAGMTGPGGIPLSSLINPALGEAGELMKPFEWKGPDDPSFKWRVEQGAKLIERSAAAKGNLITGGTAKALDEFGQNMASTEYQSAFERDRAQKADRYNRLAGISGTGQVAAGQSISSGASAADNIASILSNSAFRQGEQLNNAAAARASGYVGGANAWQNGLGSATNGLTTLALLKLLQPGGVPWPLPAGSGA